MEALSLPLLLEPARLAAHLSDSRLLVVDLGDPAAYGRGHVPGAVPLGYGSLVRAAPPVGGLLPDADTLAAVLGAVGVAPDRWVVAYDDEGGGRAARLLWTLDAVGHRGGGSLLDGGMRAWAPEGYPMDTAPVTPVPAQCPVRVTGDAVAVREDIEPRLGSDDLALLDARSPAEYAGVDRRAARGGRIPGAASFEWTRALDPARGFRMREAAALREELEALGVTPQREVVTYCQTHHRSSYTYWMLRCLGYERVRGYPGSWSDWGNAPDTPVETG